MPIDDVISTGGLDPGACKPRPPKGGVAVAAVALVDRRDHGEREFANRGPPYFAVVTLRPSSIEPREP